MLVGTIHLLISLLTGDIHHPHSPPVSSSPSIVTVSASTDQEMEDTGKLIGTECKEANNHIGILLLLSQ